MKIQTVACWLCLVPAAIGIIISVAKGKPNVLAKLCSMHTIILSVFIPDLKKSGIFLFYFEKRLDK